MYLSYGVVSLLVLILDIYCILQVISGRGDAGIKLLWIILILVFPFLGAVLYILLGRSRLV